MSLLDEIRRRRGRVSKLWTALSADEPFLKSAFELYEAAMHQPGGLSRRHRELLCLITSSANDCAYCLAHHDKHLLAAGQAPAEVEALVHDPAAALADPLDTALQALALKLAASGEAGVARELARLEGLGLDPLQCQQALQVCATYALFNRLANGLAVGMDP